MEQGRCRRPSRRDWCRHCGSVTAHRYRGTTLLCASCHPEPEESRDLDLEPESHGARRTGGLL